MGAPPFTVKQLLHNSVDWYRHPDDSYNVTYLNAQDSYVKQNVSCKDIAAYDPHLLSLLEQLASNSVARGGIGCAPQSLLRTTYALWNGDTRMLRSTDGETLLVSKLVDIRASRDAASRVLTVEFMETATIDGSTLPYAIYSDIGEITVTAAWLSETFPGWQDRLAVADGLELDWGTRLTYLFSPTLPLPKTDLTGVTFS